MPKINHPPKKKIGLLGGTFDPIHNGHLHIAEQVMKQKQLDEVWFIPSGTPPHRTTPHFSAADRFKMCELALQDKPRFTLCDIETHQKTPSYTIDTVNTLKAQHPNHHFYFIIGMDAFLKIHHWHNAKALLNSIDILVVNRNDLKAPPEMNEKRVEFVTIPRSHVSSTQIRRDLAHHLNDLPSAVKQYIKGLSS